ncbi:ParB/RepB/Spo0J family partition protein [Fusibacillus kribbianus]|uniref:ParB/RepB/Spo0J family partition protein n=1 Tax=Fusibacillus kribbianus TaxID=3044208 RepID=A0AAP4BCP9_9FIRM|nr:ParB/RepB/Spo0J family partition protein [Ruminococcus sp. YH-rum2234]MDI9242738.1 ParB/RepB/Spo0J family partition protein [Ruminococcus sp. YH-rum2234]
MKTRPGQKIQIKSVEELLGVVNEEAAMDIEIYKITSFADHPFKVVDDEKMQELVESIRVNGVLSPVLIRPKGMDTYEMISGHRRLHAAQLAGLESIPAIIRELSDDEATIAMVDANIQREELLPSEKAFAYKMKMDAMRRQAGRPTKENARQNVGNFETADIIGKDNGESGRQVQRYIRLTELVPELLEFVDCKRLQFTVAVDISYIDKEIQRWLYEYIKENGIIKAKQIALLREACTSGPMTQAKMISILNESQPGRTPSSKNIISEKKLREYFPDDYTAADMRSVILELLEQWKNGRE